MNADRLLELYEQISKAPDAIVRLRRFVLDLAVRGKLVEQESGDEPAPKLVQRIDAEKRRLVAGGEIRTRDAKPVAMLDPPFPLPPTWCWTAVGASFAYDAGSKTDPKDLLPDAWLLELEDIEKTTGQVLQRLKVSERSSKSTKSAFSAGDILYGKLRPYLNKVVVAENSGYSTTEIVAIRPFLPLCSEYVALAFRRPDFVDYVERMGQGTKMPRLRTEDAIVSPFPLPPLAEQHRIVAKVDELMALCDRLEEARKTREETRDKLTAASLARLTAPDTTAEDFPAHARFALDALPSLTSRPDQIKTLRRTILNLAVRGKLVEQESIEDFECDLEMLAKLETQRLETSKNRTDQARVSTEFDGIRKMWRANKLSPRRITTFCSCHFITKGTTPSKDKLGKEGDVPFLKVYNIVSNSLDFAYRPAFTSQETHNAGLARSKVYPGDVIMNIVGPPLGKVAIISDEYAEWNINQALAFFRPLQGISNRYLAMILQASDTLREVLSETRGTVGQDNLSLEQVRSISFPFIPLAEQHRIVAKVESLMALCDRLEAALTEANTTRTRLLEALLHEALEPTSGTLKVAGL